MPPGGSASRSTGRSPSRHAPSASLSTCSNRSPASCVPSACSPRSWDAIPPPRSLPSKWVISPPPMYRPSCAPTPKQNPSSPICSAGWRRPPRRSTVSCAQPRSRSRSMGQWGMRSRAPWAISSPMRIRFPRSTRPPARCCASRSRAPSLPSRTVSGKCWSCASA